MSHNLVRMAKWFLVRADVEAASLLLTNVNDPGAEQLRDYIHKFWPQFFSVKEYARVYEEAGEIEAKVDMFHVIPSNDRYFQLASIVKQLPNVHKILDFGCSKAMYAIHMHNAFGKRWTCVDIDGTSIKEARKIVARYANFPDSFDFIVGDEDSLELRVLDNQYDAALCFEVLEHVLNPTQVLETLERVVKPGGWIVISIPWGPIEYDMWLDYPERNREHIREFGFQDLMDLFGKHEDLSMTFKRFVPLTHSSELSGSFIVAYKVDDTPLGKINWERKLALWNAPDLFLPGLVPTDAGSLSARDGPAL